jgi:hypothetical protein
MSGLNTLLCVRLKQRLKSLRSINRKEKGMIPKRFPITLFLLLSVAITAPAQITMHIYRNGETISYALPDIQKITFSGVTEVKDLAKMDQIVKGFKLNSNYPNPFNPSTTISYQLNEPGLVQLRILDVTGREVTTLLSMRQNAGNYHIPWNGQTVQGRSAVSGVYFYQVTVNGQSEAKKMILLK